MTEAWFNHCTTLEEAKAEYRRLCFMYHPDHGGDHEVMQTINRAYATFKRTFRPRPARTDPSRSSPPPWRAPTYPQPRPQSKRWTPPPPPATASRQHVTHSPSYVYELWEHAPWHSLKQGRFTRHMWGHTAAIVLYPPNNSDGTWVVFVDDDISPYMFYSREEAEKAAFEMLYEKVKHRPL